MALVAERVRGDRGAVGRLEVHAAIRTKPGFALLPSTAYSALRKLAPHSSKHARAPLKRACQMRGIRTLPCIACEREGRSEAGHTEDHGPGQSAGHGRHPLYAVAIAPGSRGVPPARQSGV